MHTKLSFVKTMLALAFFIISCLLLPQTGSASSTTGKGSVHSKPVQAAGISVRNALYLGSKKATKKIIVFTDPDCPFCGIMHDEMKKVVSLRPDIAFYIKLYPLVQIHPDAYWKSKAIVCKKSMTMLEKNFHKQPIDKADCKTSEVDNTITEARKLGITGTPAMVLPVGKVMTGAMRAEDIISLVDGKTQ